MKDEEILELVKELADLDISDPANDYNNPTNKPARMVEIETILQNEGIMDSFGCFIYLLPKQEKLMDEIDKIIG